MGKAGPYRRKQRTHLTTLNPAARVCANVFVRSFAVYDEKQKLQYVGTTTDLRNALRTALGRRPEKTFYYK
jgi:hypothetical protein